MADHDQIHLLVIEDSEDDAELLVREIERGGYRLQSRRVDTAEDLRGALADGDWDLVIADYTMPRFSGADALAMVRGYSMMCRSFSFPARSARRPQSRR